MKCLGALASDESAMTCSVTMIFSITASIMAQTSGMGLGGTPATRYPNCSLRDGLDPRGLPRWFRMQLRNGSGGKDRRSEDLS